MILVLHTAYILVFMVSMLPASFVNSACRMRTMYTFWIGVLVRRRKE